jgi:hypothetical protein
MPCTQAFFDANFVPEVHNKDGLGKVLVPVTNAGDPTGALTPEFVGQFCHDTTNSALYWAHGLAAANWKKLSP